MAVSKLPWIIDVKSTTYGSTVRIVDARGKTVCYVYAGTGNPIANANAICEAMNKEANMSDP